MKSTDNCINSGTCNTGTEVKVAVNSTETMRARMLTYTEAEDFGCTLSKNSCPIWLTTNLDSSNTAEQPWSYYTSSAYGTQMV